MDRRTPTMVDGCSLPKICAMSLTPHQRTVLNYIGEFQHKRGYSPSLSDLAMAFNVRSKNAVAKVVNAKAMFGGYGIFLNGLMFALIADSVLHLKVDEKTEKQFKTKGLDKPAGLCYIMYYKEASYGTNSC